MSSLVLNDPVEQESELDLSLRFSMPCISKKFLLFWDITKAFSGSLNPFKPTSLNTLDRSKLEYAEKELYWAMSSRVTALSSSDGNSSIAVVVDSHKRSLHILSLYSMSLLNSSQLVDRSRESSMSLSSTSSSSSISSSIIAVSLMLPVRNPTIQYTGKWITYVKIHCAKNF